MGADASRACVDALGVAGVAGRGIGARSARISVRVGIPLERRDGLVVPLSWRAEPTIFPVSALTADLEVTAMGRGRTRLTLMGHYEPLVRRQDSLVDGRLAHRVAETSIRLFLSRIARSLSRRR